MWNVGLDKVQTGIKIAGRNINNLRYADDTTLMAESEEELKSLLISGGTVIAAGSSTMQEKVSGSGETGIISVKTNIQKSKIMACGPITLWQIDGETMETVTHFIFLGFKITAGGDLKIWN